jgi:hypothetical protein
MAGSTWRAWRVLYPLLLRQDDSGSKLKLYLTSGLDSLRQAF